MVDQNNWFTISSFIAELILLHAQGKRLLITDAIKLIDSGDLLSEIEKLGFNNQEFINPQAKCAHFEIINSVISDLYICENDASTIRVDEQCGLLYVAIKLLNRA